MVFTSCCCQVAGARSHAFLLMQVEVEQKEKMLDTIQAKMLELKQLCNTNDIPTSLQVGFVIQVHEHLGQHVHIVVCTPLSSNFLSGHGG